MQNWKRWKRRGAVALAGAALLSGSAFTRATAAQNVTFKPYIQPGDAGAFGPKDSIVIAWQTDEAIANPGAYTVEYGATTTYGSSLVPTGRVVDNYLSADPVLAALSIPTAYGAHTDYYATLANLDYDTTYYYRVKGPGLPTDGFTAAFHTRKRGTHFSFEVQGDEGYYPGIPNSNPPRVVDYQARIIHLMYNVQNLSVPGAPSLPPADLALNTGDNVYITGSDGNYRDFWMGDWNNDADSNEYGAPFLRSIPFYIVDGNHDVGGSGASVNLLADSGATVPGSFGPGRYGGGTGGGDALAHFNNFYFPLNGPAGVDIQNIFNGDAVSPTGMFFNYNNVNYTSPAAIEAYRASTTVDTGKGSRRQIDHESNYSFDYGNTHFVFLDANPHLFNALLPGGTNWQNPPSFPFPAYPSVLRDWLINDLDSSAQTWKVVVYHQPAFSSGNATIRNDQMRRVAKFLEDHGVNIVFNGHEHNYQRTRPIRALSRVADTPKTPAPAAVAIDQKFDGVNATVPDGVLYIVEGAGGNRDFDDDLPNPRGGGAGIDQDDAATGTYAPPNTPYVFPNGPASWLDTNLTNTSMTPFLAKAGSGPKITVKFKSKIFSFADVIVNDNALTLYQISEPLTNASSGTPDNPAPYGRDINGAPLNDPIPDTIIDPLTGQVISPPADGVSALLDKFTLTKPDITGQAAATLSAPPAALPGGALVYTLQFKNNSPYALNGAQAVVALPNGVQFAGQTGTNTTVQDSSVVVTIGRLEKGATKIVQVKCRVASNTPVGTDLLTTAALRSGTVLPVSSNSVHTTVVSVHHP